VLSVSIANATPPTGADIQLAIDNGLDWLRTNQYVDLTPTYPWGCWGDASVRFGGAHPSDPHGDVGVTALCAWAFIDEGVTEFDGTPEGVCLGRAIQYLTNHILPDGSITNVGAGTVNYHTSMSIIALFATHNPGAIHNDVGITHSGTSGVSLTRAEVIENARNYLKSIQYVPPYATPDAPPVPPGPSYGPPVTDICHGGWSYADFPDEDDGWTPDPLPDTDIDVMIRDNKMDIGDVPTDPPFWTSPDIWVDNDGDGTPDLIDPTIDNTIHVRVWNRGNAIATGVEVNVYHSPPNAALTLPTGATNITDPANPPIIPSIDSGAFETVIVTWNQNDIPPDAILACLGAIALVPGVDEPTTDMVRVENNLAARNMACLVLLNDDPNPFDIIIGNPFNVPITTILRVFIGQSDIDPNAWELGIEGESPEPIPDEPGIFLEIQLAANETVVKTITMKPNETLPQDKLVVGMTEIVIQQGHKIDVNNKEPIGGYTIMAQITDDPAEVGPITPCPPIHKQCPDLSNTQWSIMAMALTENPLAPYGGVGIPNARWAGVATGDGATKYIDRTQQNFPEISPSGDNMGRGFDYMPHDEEDPFTHTHGSMSYAGIWSQALMRVPGLWPTPIDEIDAIRWAQWHYSVADNPNWGQQAYYYYAVTMAKALKMSHIPFIYEPSSGITHNWYLELAEELVVYPASPAGMHKQTAAGFWVNTPSPDFGEHSKALCTAYAILVLQTKNKLCCVVKIILDKLRPEGVIDFSVRDYLSRLTDKLEQNIPGSEYIDVAENDTQYIITLGLPVGEENCTLAPETYRIILENLGNDPEGYNLTIEVYCDLEVAPISREKFENREIEPGQRLISNLNLSTIAGQTTVFVSEPTETSVFDVPDEVVLEVSECDDCLKGHVEFDISAIGDEPIHNVTVAVVSGDDSLTDEEIWRYFKFDPNGFNLDPNGTETVMMKACIPPEIDVSTLQAMILVQAGNAEPEAIPLTINVISTVVGIGEVTAGPGEPVQVPVWIQQEAGLDIVSIELDIGYDAAMLTAIEAKPAGIASDWQVEYNLENGKIAMIADPSPTDPNPLQGDGVFMEILFEVSGGSCECAKIRIERVRLNEYDDLDIGLCHGKICIEVLGDLNGDGEVTALDALLALQVVVDLRHIPDEEFPCLTRKNADISKNGKLTAFDGALILQIAVGIDIQPLLANTAPTDNIRNHYVGFGEAQKRNGRLIVPVTVDDASGILSGELTLNYDSSRVKPVGASASYLTKGYSVVANPTDGQFTVTFAGANSLNGSGSLVNLGFETLDNTQATLPLTLAKVQINEKEITTIKSELVRIIPDKMVLLQNFPNPFNPETWIPYQLSKDNNVQIRIFNVSGQLVRSISLGYQQAGVYSDKNHAAYWDGRNAASEKVSSGVYFYTIQAGDFNATRKMLIVK